MKKLIQKIKSIDKGTFTRTIALGLAIANQIIAVIGSTSFASAVWYQVASVVMTILTSALAAWENNDFTYFAQLTSKVFNALKDGKITVDEVLSLVDKDEDNSADITTESHNS